jgi:hypothetical protein
MNGVKNFLLQLEFLTWQVHKNIQKYKKNEKNNKKLASSIGIARGIFLGMPRNLTLPRKLLMNNFFNAVGKESSRFG